MTCKFTLTTSFILFLVLGAEASTCNWGLFSGENSSCAALETIAATRMNKAKTICAASGNNIQWNKNEKNVNPNVSFRLMEQAMVVVASGYTRVYSCKRADLVAKFEVDKVDNNASLEVSDADSGAVVFRESRDLKDEENDLYRLARHFQDAKAEAKEQLAQSKEAERRERENTEFYVSLPRDWHYLRSCDIAVDKAGCLSEPSLKTQVWSDGKTYLKEAAERHNGNLVISTSCITSPGDGDTWKGTCTYKYAWNGENSVTATEILGTSQAIDNSPLKMAPPACPKPANYTHPFVLEVDK